MQSRTIVYTVADRHKAQAVHDCFTGEVAPMHLASILRHHDPADAASLFDRQAL